MSLKNGDRDHVGVKDSSADLGLVLSNVEGMTIYYGICKDEQVVFESCHYEQYGIKKKFDTPTSMAFCNISHSSGLSL
jgi:hypothetical protein